MIELRDPWLRAPRSRVHAITDSFRSNEACSPLSLREGERQFSGDGKREREGAESVSSARNFRMFNYLASYQPQSN